MRLLARVLDTARGYGRLAEAEILARRGSRRTVGTVPHLLLIAATLPPEVTGGVYRPTSILRAAESHGWNATAIARAPASPPSEAGTHLLRTISDSVRFLRVVREPFVPSAKLFPQVDGGLPTALEMFRVGRRAFRDEVPAAVLASGPPFSSFVAAYYLAEHFGTKLVLDYRDEWTECPFDFVHAGPTDRRFEARLLARADAVLFTTRSQVEHQLAAFPTLDEERCHLVPNGWDAAVAPESRPDHRSGGGEHLRISFVGTVAPYTDPTRFLATLERLLEADEDLRNGLRVRFVGRIDGPYADALDSFPYPDVVERRGLVPLDQAKAEMREAGALILFAGPELARYLPGKLAEYIGARRPILIYGADGEAGRLVESLGVGRRVPDGDPDELAHAIQACGDDHSEADAWIADHRRDAIASRLYRLLDDLTGSAPQGRQAALRSNKHVS